MLSAFPLAQAGPSVLDLVLDAGIVAKFVLLLLLAASIASWGIIVARARVFRAAARETRSFLGRFHGGARLAELRDLAEKVAPFPRRGPVQGRLPRSQPALPRVSPGGAAGSSTKKPSPTWSA
ncbi:MAG: hypothetical protein Q9Q13_06605 [Acidobacteriota bacterium]|nr:hypothetical protein [Acidobacteriota bacterium]